MPVAQHHRRGPGAPHQGRGPGRAGQLDRALQSAGPRGRRIRHARLHLRRAAGGRLPGRHLDGHQLLLRPDPGADPREVRRGARADHQAPGPTREPFAFNGRYNKLRHVNIWPRPIQQPHPPIHIPGGGSVETYDFCIDNTYSYSYLSFTGYIRAKALMEGYWDRVEERGAPDKQPLPGRLRPDHLRRRDRRGGRAPLLAARQLLLQSLPARLSGLRRRARLPHHQDHPDRRAVAIRPAARRLRRADLEGPDRGRPRHRRQPGDGAPAHGGTDQGPARRQHLLPHARRQHADRQVHVFDQAVRREGDAEAAQHVPRVGRATSRFWCHPIEKRVTAGSLPAQPTTAPRRRGASAGSGRVGAASWNRRPSRPEHAPVRYLEGGSGEPLVFLHGAGGMTAGRSAAGRARRALPRLCARSCPGYGETEECGDAARHARLHPARLGRGRGAGAEESDPGRPFDGRHDRRGDGGAGAATTSRAWR